MDEIPPGGFLVVPIGHGPHVVRGMEFYKGRLIAYSLGNFAGYHNFTLEGVLADSAILHVRAGRLRVLAVTGAETLYADMGHFGRKAIGFSWLALVYPCLMLNYLGQGALLLGVYDNDGQLVYAGKGPGEPTVEQAEIGPPSEARVAGVIATAVRLDVPPSGAAPVRTDYLSGH